MRRNLDTVLDECLAALRDGTSASACLARYPEHADELAPLLATISEVGRVLTPPSSSAARAAGQRQMLAALAARNAHRARTPAILLGLRQLLGTFSGALRPAWNLVAVAVAILFVATSGVTVAASADALPGDALYSVKLVSQKAQLAFIFNPVRQGLMQDQFSNQQRMDVEAVLAGGRQETVEFEGVLQRMDGSLWVVGGLSVTVQENTTISGEPHLGMVVRVRGELPGDGSLLATTVTVDSSSEPWISDTVEPTDTVEPAETPEPAKTPEPTGTLESAESEDPDKSDQASGTPEPLEDEHTVDVPKWDETAEASETAETPDPVETHEPTGTPEGEHEAEPSETPDLDDESDSSDDAAETPEADDDDDSDHRDSADTPEATDEPDEDDGSDDDDESDDDDDSSDPPDSDDPPDEDDDPEEPDD